MTAIPATWATQHKADLAAGHTVQFRPRGTSMAGLIEDRQLVTVSPLAGHTLRVGDIVLARVRGWDYLHKITAIDAERVQIGNNRGHINGWTSRRNVFGLVTKVEC